MRWFFASVAGASLVAAIVWGRAVLIRLRFLRRVEIDTTDPDARVLATSSLAHLVHASGVYVAVGVAAGVEAITDDEHSLYLLGLVIIPILATIWLARYTRRDARLSHLRLGLEQRAHEVLSQDELAPQRWAERLAPSRFPDTSGYEVGTAHQAGAGVMSGDLLDVFRLPSDNLCCVVGDVSGHDVEASISALQTKFLLRTYLRRYRDPGQALEELNRQLIDHERPEEFVSLFVVVFDDEAWTLRYASAGHPAGWLCSERNPRALRATGPLLMMDAASRFRSAELPYQRGDLVVMSTDGLLEARQGDQFFGEDRVAGLVRRDWDMSTQVLCKTLIDEAVDFSAGPLADDVTVLAVRKR
jgi:serine phosphatase RsbU (regulator of sigma subunit)